MSLRHLTRRQNSKIGEMLFGVAKAVLAAGIIAFIYPPAGQVRSFEWLLAS